MDTPDIDTLTAIHRKIRAPVGPFDTPGATLAKSMRLAVVRAVEEQTGLEVAVSGFSEAKITLADAADGISGNDLIFMADGPGAAIGLVILDTAALSALMEQLVTGRVVPGDRPGRKPTATDAAVISGILGAILALSDEGLKQVTNPPPISGFRTSSVLEDGRAVSLALEDIDYRCLWITLDMGQGTNAGLLRLIFPWTPVLNSHPNALASSDWGRDWQNTVEKSGVTIEAVLLRLAISIGDVSELKVGDFLPLPVDCIGNVSVEGSDHRTVATGKLGQSNGYRAVRLDNVDPVSSVEQPAPTDYFQLTDGDGAGPVGPPMVDSIEPFADPSAEQGKGRLNS